MWSFLKQAEKLSKKGEGKQGKKEEEKKDVKKRKGRTFLASWKVIRDWLKYEGGVMFCSVCREVDEGEKTTNNNFVKGKSNLRLENVKDHEKSKFHRVASLKLRNSQNPIQETSAGIALSSLTKAQTDRVKILMRNTHLLTEHFKSVLNAQNFNEILIMSEWEGLKAFIYSNKDWDKKLKTASSKSFNRSHGNQFPNLLDLIDLILTIQASTADCEREFSTMKRIKSDWRASLGTSTLSDLMCGLLESCDINTYDPSSACGLWADDMHRKPAYRRVKPVGSKHEASFVSLGRHFYLR